MPESSKKPKKYSLISFRAQRLPRYKEALRVRQLKQPDLSLADWCREACDKLAARDLGPLERAYKNGTVPKHEVRPVTEPDALNEHTPPLGEREPQ